MKRCKCLYLLILFSLLLASVSASADTENSGVESAEKESIESETPESESVEESVESEELSIEEEELLEEQKKELFKVGYEKFNNKDYKDALLGFYNYMQMADSSDENFEWAHFFYGVSLEKLGYSHAAVDTFTNIVTRKPNTKIVIYILSYFDVISRKQPFDQELLIARALNSTDYGFVDDDLAAMVHYHQGLYDNRYGLGEWAQGHFDKIPKESVYYGHYLYHAAIEETRKNDLEKALTFLLELLSLPNLDPKLTDLAHWTSARLYFELKQHDKAIQHYKWIKTSVAEQASFLLERAWNQYKLSNQQRALGLLYAYEAPNFERFFTPEMFILKALIYKSLCQYESTLTTVEEFYARYQKALDAVYDRKAAADPESKTLLYLILNDEVVRQQWAFLQLLEKEVKLIKKIKDPDLSNHINAIYSLKVEQTAKHLRINVDREYERLANLLLEYEENINLVRYEAGVDQYQSASRLRYSDTQVNEKQKADNKGKVIYRFQGEFWNDEFDDYKVHLSDECNQEQEWEVFFK